MTDETSHITGHDHVAKPVGVMITADGQALPAQNMTMARFTPPGDNPAQLVVMTSWYSEHGLYTLLTPDGARAVGKSLINAAQRADDANAENAAKALSKATRKGGA